MSVRDSIRRGRARFEYAEAAPARRAVADEAAAKRAADAAEREARWEARWEARKQAIMDIVGKPK
jgi:hypothetical protein